jgi:hypothetical protein
MKTSPVVGAINRYRLARAQRDGPPQKRIDRADFCVEIGQVKRAGVIDMNFAISLPPNQFIHKVSHGDAAVARESIAEENAHSAETGLRPQSLATQ